MTITHERNWTEIGKEAYGAQVDAWIIDKQVIAAAIDSMRNSWLNVDAAWVHVAIMPGLGIQTAIKELRLPKVSAYCLSNELAPYGLYGVEANYTNGRARVYILDRGSDMLPLVSDFYPKEEA